MTGYTNVYTLIPDESRLYGTEDLYGDWDGRALLLAKDFACSDVIHERIRGGDPRPYRHEPKLRTNKMLRRRADMLAKGDNPETCGLLYGSALACLLRNDGKMSGALPNRKEAIVFGERVLGFVLEQMPRLRSIVCLGDESWRCAMGALGATGCWAGCRDSGQTISANGVTVIGAFHPAARISGEKAGRPWDVVRKVLGSQGLADAA